MAKIAFIANLAVEHETVLRNIAHAKGLGLAYVTKVQPHGRRLAVVGGGPSIVAGLDELRRWEGDIWSLNGACRWLRERGVDSTLLTLDPLPIIAKSAQGASKAILCSRCDPSVFEVLKDADVRLFDCVQDVEGGVWASCSTCLVAFDLATDLGYREIVFFGCEGSYEATTHTYMDDPQTHRFVVECGGQEYLTLPELYVTTVQMAVFLRKFPAHFKEKSGGLLRAMVAHEEHDIVKVSRALLAGITPMKEAA